MTGNLHSIPPLLKMDFKNEESNYLKPLKDMKRKTKVSKQGLFFVWNLILSLKSPELYLELGLSVFSVRDRDNSFIIKGCLQLIGIT